MEYEIKNQFLNVKINSRGAELASVKVSIQILNSYGKLIQKFGIVMHQFCFQLLVA